MAGDRLEMNFAVNVAGVYAITELLMPALNRGSPDSRVITVASGGMLTENLTEVLQVFLLLRHSNCEKLKFKPWDVEINNKYPAPGGSHSMRTRTNLMARHNMHVTNVFRSDSWILAIIYTLCLLSNFSIHPLWVVAYFFVSPPLWPNNVKFLSHGTM